MNGWMAAVLLGVVVVGVTTVALVVQERLARIDARRYGVDRGRADWRDVVEALRRRESLRDFEEQCRYVNRLDEQIARRR